MAMIEVKAVTKIYRLGDEEVHALDGVDLQIESGELVAIMGPSGSGKSTLMAILGGLDIPTSGSYTLDGNQVEKMNDNQLADIRSRQIGFVFQQFNLLPRTRAVENVMLPLMYGGVRGRQRVELANSALEMVGLSDRKNHKPNQLSGGQQQRVAIARAIVNNPAILLADEPTGNLDSKTGAEIIMLFQKLHKNQGQTVVFVTHDPFIAQHTERIIHLADGKVCSDERVAIPLIAGQAVRPDSGD